MKNPVPRLGSLVKVPPKDIGHLSPLLNLPTGKLGLIIDVREINIFPGKRKEILYYVLLENKVNNNAYNFSARLEIEYLNSKYNFKIPVGDYDTLGGFILDYNKNLPKKGEIIKFDNYLIKILSMNDNRIDSVFFKENV